MDEFNKKRVDVTKSAMQVNQNNCFEKGNLHIFRFAKVTSLYWEKTTWRGSTVMGMVCR